MTPYPVLDGTQSCASLDPEFFFPDATHEAWKVTVALDACQRCPFRPPCLRYALSHDVAGIWGGTTEKRRTELRLAFAITVSPQHPFKEKSS